MTQAEIRPQDVEQALDVDQTTTFGRFTGHSAALSAREGSSIMLFGKAGSGKTTLAASLAEDPDNCPVWIQDAEGGTKVVSDQTGIQVFPMHTWADEKEFRAEI